MDLIIDGYNLLHAVGIHAPRCGPQNLEGARGVLIRFLVASLSTEALKRTTVVFDAGPDAPRGLPRSLVEDGMTIRFAAGYDSADTLIEELILACSSPRSLTVVSSDHRIQRAAKKRRAEAIDSEVWYARMCKTKIDTTNTVADKPHAPQSSEEVQAWLQKFQADGTESGMTGKSEIEAIEKGLQGSGPFPPGYADDVIDSESDLRD